MQIQHIFALFLFFISTKVFAVGAVQTFATKPECLSYFASSTGSNDAVAAENFCKDKIKSAIDICAEKKLLDLKMRNSISSLDEPRYLQKFKTECLQAAQITNQQSQQLAQQQAQLQAQQLAQQQQAAARQNQGSSGGQQQQSNAANTLDVAKKIAPAIIKAEKAYDSAKAQEAKSADNAAGKTSNGSSAVLDKNDGTYGTAIENGGATPAATSSANSAFSDDVAKRQAENSWGPTQPQQQGMLTDEAINNSISEGKTSAQATSAQGNDLKAAAPETAPAVDKAQGAVKTGDKVEPQETKLTEESKADTKDLENQIDSVVKNFENANYENTGVSMSFDQTRDALAKVKKIIANYKEAKATCESLTEKTELLCLQNKSAGVVATKELMDTSGPILAAINSAQKACSSTAKVTRFAGTVLTVAKGVCVATQLSCMASCASALSKLNSEIAALNKEIDTALSNDATNNYNERCMMYTEPSEAQICMQQQTNKVQAAHAAQASLQKAAAIEDTTKPGTSASLAATCKAKVSDILMMAGNIASLALAKKSADECDRKLAAAGTAGSTVTPTQYCESPANANTQMCKCQRNSQQEGCPGYTATATANKDKPSEVAGTHLPTGGGLTGFAGGTPGRLNPSKNAADNKFNSDGSTTSDSSSLSLPGSSNALAGSATGGAGFNGSGRGSGGSGDDTKDKKEVEKKKWSFGSFANSLSGMFGGGKKNSKTSNNGGLSARQESAIKRKLASDKLAAEISSASGKSNWEKVRQAYLIKENTFDPLLTGQ